MTSSIAALLLSLTTLLSGMQATLNSIIGVIPATQVAQVVTATNASLLQPSDFTYQGYYDVQTNGNDTSYAQGLALRYVNGDLRLMMLQLNGSMHEFSIGGKSYGSVINSTTNSWNLGSTGTLMDFNGFWWNPVSQKLMYTKAVDYTATDYPATVTSVSLGANGSLSNLSTVTLGGLHAKRVYGGVQPVPAWFQSQYGVGPFVVGWGGYTSLVLQGGNASLGLTMYAIPDPSNYSNGSTISSGSIKTIADHLFSGQDWYANGSPTSFDRTKRITNPINYFDGGDTRPNGTTELAPTGDPISGAQWLSPAPDGKGRWVWGDSYYNTGVWIDTATKTGFIAIASLGGGKVWYCNSTLCFQKRQFELHIYDPNTLGKAALGQLQPWQVQPASMTDLTSQLVGLNTVGSSGDTQVGNVTAAAYDSAGQKLYVAGCGVNQYYCRIFVYSVNAGTGTSPSPTPTVSAPTVSLSTSATSVVSGTPVTLTWSSTNATSCSANWTSSTGTSGSQSVTPTANTTYSISCTGTGGSTSQSVAVSVTSTQIVPSSVQISASPTTITPGSASTISYSWTNNGNTHNVKINGTSPSGYSCNTSTCSGTLSVSPTVTTTYTITATDINGVALAPASATVTVSSVTLDTTAPSISITAPNAGATVSGTVSASAIVTDLGGVAGVQFKLDGSNVGSEQTASPYSASIDTTALSNASHTVSVAARDASGNIGTASITINVSNTTPTPTPTTYKVYIGETVQTTANVNVRVTGGGSLLGTQPLGSIGTIVAGPTFSNGVTWWQIDYVNAPDGWSGDDYLVQYTAPVPTDAVVSDWSAWTDTSDWSTCVNGTQTKTQIRTRTVITAATNGGSTPPLSETQTISQSCTDTTSTSTTYKFKIGDSTQTLVNLNVRDAPSSTAHLLGTQPFGTLGTIIGGPVTADNSIWWNVDYPNAPDGWSVDSYLVKVAVPTANADKFIIGDYIKTTTKVNVRSTPGGRRLGSQNRGAGGTVLSGPVNYGGYIWWKIDFDSGVDGWSVQDYLTK